MAPGYSSPYRVYGIALEQQGQLASAVLARLRFIMAEPESERAMDTAKSIVDTVAAKVAAAKDKQLTIPTSSQDKGADGAAMVATELALSVAGTGFVGAEKQETEAVPAAAKFAQTMELFLKIRLEMLAKQDKRQSAAWSAILKPLSLLSEQQVLRPFLYHVAALGHVEGAVPWINEHPDDMDKLAGVINDYHAKLKGPQ